MDIEAAGGLPAEQVFGAALFRPAEPPVPEEAFLRGVPGRGVSAFPDTLSEHAGSDEGLCAGGLSRAEAEAEALAEAESLAEFGLLAGDVGLLTQEELVGLLTVAAPERLPFDLAAAGLKAAERLIGWAGSLKARLVDSLSRGTEDPAHPNFVPDPALVPETQHPETPRGDTPPPF